MPPTRSADHDRGADREVEQRATHCGVIAAGDHEQRDVAQPDEAIGNGEAQGAVAEGLRHRDRDDEQPGHDDQHHDSYRAFFGLDDARQPRVADPRPPDHRQRRGSPDPSRTSVGSFTISAVHCVNASTKTRSKNSSSGLTDSRCRSSALSLGKRRGFAAVTCVPPRELRQPSGRTRSNRFHGDRDPGVARHPGDRIEDVLAGEQVDVRRGDRGAPTPRRAGSSGRPWRCR